MAIYAKILNDGVLIAPGFQLAVHHGASAQREMALELPFGVANFGNGDFPHVYKQLHGICSPLNLPRRHKDKISFLPTTHFYL